MHVRKSLFGLLLLVVLVVSACGGAAPAPEAAVKGAEAMVEEAAPEATMEKDASGTVVETGSSDAMTEEAVPKVTMEKEDSGTGVDAASSDAMMEEPSPEAAIDEEPLDASMPAGGDAMTELPNWFATQLTDVHTGETLTVAGLKGKVVLVETMAIWCPKCLRQQQEVKALHEALGERDDLVTLVLDVDPNKDAGDLKDYATKNGFTWTYAVAPPEVAREIGQLYGDQFLNPPSTPMFIVDRHGQVHLLPFGRKTAGDLQEALAPFLSEGM